MGSIGNVRSYASSPVVVDESAGRRMPRRPQETRKARPHPHDTAVRRAERSCPTGGSTHDRTQRRSRRRPRQDRPPPARAAAQPRHRRPRRLARDAAALRLDRARHLGAGARRRDGSLRELPARPRRAARRRRHRRVRGRRGRGRGRARRPALGPGRGRRRRERGAAACGAGRPHHPPRRLVRRELQRGRLPRRHPRGRAGAPRGRRRRALRQRRGHRRRGARRADRTGASGPHLRADRPAAAELRGRRRRDRRGDGEACRLPKGADGRASLPSSAPRASTRPCSG